MLRRVLAAATVLPDKQRRDKHVTGGEKGGEQYVSQNHTGAEKLLPHRREQTSASYG